MQELLRYQEIDAKIRKLEAKIQGSENRKKAIDMQEIVKKIQAEIVELNNVSKTLNEQYQKALSLYNEFVQKLEKLEKSIDGATDENLASLQATVQSFVKNAEVLESNIEVLAKKIDAANKKYDTLMTNATTARKNHDVYKANFMKEKATIEPELQRLKEELVKQSERVNPVLLAKYKTKRDGKIFPIVVPETMGRCGCCRVEIPASKMSELKTKGFIECENENCGMIIYRI